MIINLEHIKTASRPFWRFDVLVKLADRFVPVRGFTYREEDGVEVPWLKFGKQGKEGKRIDLVPLSEDILEGLEKLVINAIRPLEDQELNHARALFRVDEEECRRVHPKWYRALVIESLGGEDFEDLPEGRLWPDDVLRVWIEQWKRGERAKEEFLEDRKRGLTSKEDYARLIELTGGG